MPTISIITICFNNLEEVIKTCESVDMQSMNPFEHIIIDGSTNNNIENYFEGSKQPAYRSWAHEKDNGIADAFNKGIKRACGDVIVMLNSGDAFFNKDTIKIVDNEFTANPSIQWLHGKYRLLRSGIWVIIGKPFEKNKLYRGMRSVCHQSMFFKKKLHEKYGLYDTTQKIGMDYDFLCRIADESFTFIKIPIVQFAPAGISTANYLQSLRDAKKIYTKYYGKSIKLFIWQLRLKLLYYLLHSPIGHYLYKIKKRLNLENL